VNSRLHGLNPSLLRSDRQDCRTCLRSSCCIARRRSRQFRHEVPGGENWIEADTSHIWWHPAFPFALDLAQFEELIALANQPQKGQDTVTYLEQAVRLYRGDLLPALYEDWVSEHREHLRTALRAAIERLIRALANSGRYREGATYAEARHPRLPA